MHLAFPRDSRFAIVRISKYVTLRTSAERQVRIIAARVPVVNSLYMHKG